MLQIVKAFKMHIGLIKYLNKELRKKRTPKELVYFLRDIIVRYFLVNLQELKNLFLIFDKDYQIKKKEYDNFQKIKVDLQRCIKMLQYIDKKMEKRGLPNWKRKQFWRDFFKNGQIRKEEFETLLKEIG